jgi:hypothetical protein
MPDMISASHGKHGHGSASAGPILWVTHGSVTLLRLPSPRSFAFKLFINSAGMRYSQLVSAVDILNF